MIDFAKMQEIDLECREALKAFSSASYHKHGSHSYSAGYLESVLVQALLMMSNRARQMILDDLACATTNMQNQVDNDTV